MSLKNIEIPFAKMALRLLDTSTRRISKKDGGRFLKKQTRIGYKNSLDADRVGGVGHKMKISSFPGFFNSEVPEG